MICQKYRNDIHWVWCSEVFDSKSQGLYTLGAQVPRSSNPADIYRDLKKDIESRDSHSAKINEQKTVLSSLAVQWYSRGEINEEQRDDILFMVKNVSFEDWRPLLYIIPRERLEDRLKIVPPEKRAGMGLEYIIEDLNRREFDIIEL